LLITEIKNVWEEAICLATRASHTESELVDTDLVLAAGLPIRSGMRAGQYLGSAACGGVVRGTVRGYPVENLKELYYNYDGAYDYLDQQ
jgi:hypothetical protein